MPVPQLTNYGLWNRPQNPCKGTGKMPVPQVTNYGLWNRPQNPCKGTGKMPVPQLIKLWIVERASCPFLKIVNKFYLL